jgi:hypothetical protein
MSDRKPKDYHWSFREVTPLQLSTSDLDATGRMDSMAVRGSRFDDRPVGQSIVDVH